MRVPIEGSITGLGFRGKDSEVEGLLRLRGC